MTSVVLVLSVHVSQTKRALGFVPVLPSPESQRWCPSVDGQACELFALLDSSGYSYPSLEGPVSF